MVMELWGWLIVYAVLFAVIHLVLYYLYVRRDGGTNFPTTGSGTDGEHTGFRSATQADQYHPFTEETAPNRPTDDGRSCPHCGTTNDPDPAFTYCRSCISPLRH